MLQKVNIYVIIACLLYIFITVYQITDVTEACGGRYIYQIDDTYIHLSIAKNFAFHGIWGVTAHEFSSSSSSLIYPLSLSLFMLIFGNNQLLPLFINMFVSLLVIISIFSILKPHYFLRQNFDAQNKNSFLWSGFLLFIISLTIALMAPVVILTLIGMEHTIQILVNLLFLSSFIKYISAGKQTGIRNMLIFAFLVTSARYEGMFIIFIALIILLFKKDYKTLLYVLVAASLPIIIFGIISVLNGWMFLPNTILMKSTKPKTMALSVILAYPFKWIPVLMDEPHLLAIFVSCLGIFFINLKNRLGLLHSNNLWLYFTVFVMIIQVTTARLGWAYRYEAYIVVMGLIAIAVNIAGILKTEKKILKYAVSVLVLGVLITCGIRTFNSFDETKTMSVNIYQQPFQMSQFLHKYYNDSSVILGDIGATTYFTNIKLLDLVSLGSLETLKIRFTKKYNPEELDKIAKSKKMQIGILYEEVWEQYIPKHWIEAGKWTIPNNIICYRPGVIFFAINPNELNKLKHNLEDFKKYQPKEVKVDMY